MSRPASMTRRLPPRPGEVLDRDDRFTFRWEGREFPAYRGDTVVSALAACGERVFSRSFKYRRPRGILTADRLDPGCMLQVEDDPNVPGAHRRVEPGMEVRAHPAWPSLRRDVKAGIRLASRFLGPGFYYKTFMRPRALWPTYDRILRRFAAGGRLEPLRDDLRFDHRFIHPDVVVAGGGPAGMAAALGAVGEGARVLLVEEEHELGGHLRWAGGGGRELLEELRAAVARTGEIEVMVDATVTGRYDHGWVAILQRSVPGVDERLVKARPGVLVAAPGLIERPYVFEGNDLPGVMLSTAARRLVNLYAVKPGDRAVVLTANPDGEAAAADLEGAGVEVVRLLDVRDGEDLRRAEGSGRLERVEVADGTSVEADLLVVAVGWTAPTGLLDMAGGRSRYDNASARFVPGELPGDVLPTGGLSGDGTTDQLIEHGRAVGAEAARRAGGGVPSPIPPLRPDPHPALFRAATHGFVDLCEDVTSKDLLQAVAEGYDSIELVKRYTTATMGPTQGKLEMVNAVAVVAEATGRTIGETGTTTWRPPLGSISLGALAGRRHEPVQRSPIDPWHRAHGARPMVAGRWIRPEHYGDPGGEARNVRERVGIIDVSPLGKLDLRGPDVPRLLELLYVNRWSKLSVGRVRYGVMCAEDGVVLDDGVTGRLGPEHYLMTTTTSGAETVAEWVESWLQTERPAWRMVAVPVTSAYASMNVAGPRSRELVSRLVDEVDLDPEAFPYLHVRTGRVAGVNGCVIWRIGFTGELSYEVHVPSGHGLHVWEAFLEAGADLGIRPFGIEAQRVLRLEKGHLIVGQDTDGLTRPAGAGLGGLVKTDKPDFAGKPELEWSATRGDHWRLVGIQPEDPDAVPPEASQIVEEGSRIVGRITSSRMSPSLGRSICLARLDPRLAVPGSVVTVRLPDGRGIEARVTEGPAHFDPEGERLHG